MAEPRRFDSDPRLTLWKSAVAAWGAAHVLALASAVVAAHRYGGSLRTALASWDGQWYLRIAHLGYPHSVATVNGKAVQSTIGFFPGYPVLIRTAHLLVPLSLPTVAIAVSWACALPATYLFGRLVAVWWGASAANRATLVFALFPGSVVLSMVYPEGLMLMGAIGCLLLLRQKRWVLAGLAGAAATFTRPNAVAVCFACAWVAAQEVRHRRDWRALAAPAIAPLGMLGYLLYIGLRTGELNAWTRVEHDGWHVSNDVGQQYLHRIVDTVTGRAATADDIILAVSSVLAMALLVWLIRMRPPPMITVTAIAGSALMISDIVGAIPRFVLGVFPLLVPPSVQLRGRSFVVVVVVLGVASALLMVHLYGNFASGKAVLLSP